MSGENAHLVKREATNTILDLLTQREHNQRVSKLFASRAIEKFNDLPDAIKQKIWSSIILE